MPERNRHRRFSKQPVGVAAPSLVGRQLGAYRIEAAIGAGGMGEVYRARDTRLHSEVAIKVLPAEVSRDPDRLRRFEQEAKAVSARTRRDDCD